MHATEIVAYHADGAAYCPDCATRQGFGDDEETGVVCAEHLYEAVGETCDSCQRCLDDSGEWQTRDDICNPRLYRWTRCSSCNSQQPHEVAGWEYAENRLKALRGRLFCQDCGDATHF